MCINSKMMIDITLKEFDILYKMIQNEARQLNKKGYDKDAADDIMIRKFKSKTGIFKEYFDMKDFIMSDLEKQLCAQPINDWTCLQCGTVNQKDRKYCSSCGCSGAAWNCIECGKLVTGDKYNSPADMYICPHCRYDHDDLRYLTEEEYAEYVKENYNTEDDETESENTEFEIFCYLLYRFREFGDESVKYEYN